MRVAASVLAIVVTVLAVRDLYVLRAAWSVTLAILVAGGALIAVAFALRSARTQPARRARGALPADPGFPKPERGAPYRGI